MQIQTQQAKNKKEDNKEENSTRRHPKPFATMVTVVPEQRTNVEGCPTNRQSSSASSCRTSKQNQQFPIGLAINSFFLALVLEQIFLKLAQQKQATACLNIWVMATPPSQRKQLVVT